MALDPLGLAGKTQSISQLPPRSTKKKRQSKSTFVSEILAAARLAKKRRDWDFRE
jgi:hypothetical protein